MAICTWCMREMLDGEGCSVKTVDFPDGQILDSIPYELENITWPCHDCGAPVGGYHHPGCDRERCPKCEGQLISCGCLDENEENEEI